MTYSVSKAFAHRVGIPDDKLEVVAHYTELATDAFSVAKGGALMMEAQAPERVAMARQIAFWRANGGPGVIGGEKSVLQAEGRVGGQEATRFTEVFSGASKAAIISRECAITSVSGENILLHGSACVG